MTVPNRAHGCASRLTRARSSRRSAAPGCTRQPSESGWRRCRWGTSV